MTESSPWVVGDAWAGLRVVAADRRRYGPLLLGMAGAAYIVVPEGIATAYAHLLGYGAPAVGLLMASVATGHVVGAVAGRAADDRAAAPDPDVADGVARRGAADPLPGPAAGWPARPSCSCWPGLGSSFQVTANTAFARAVPHRGARPGLRARDDRHVRRAVDRRHRGRRCAPALVRQRLVVAGAAVLGRPAGAGAAAGRGGSAYLGGRAPRRGRPVTQPVSAEVS